VKSEYGNIDGIMHATPGFRHFSYPAWHGLMYRRV